MYYRINDKPVRENYGFSGKEKCFPLWALILIIALVVFLAGFLIWKMSQKTTTQNFGFRFY